MLEPSSSEEDEDYEPSSWLQPNKDTSLKPPTANGGPRAGSPNVVDGGGAGGKGKGDARVGSPSPSLNSVKALNGDELKVGEKRKIFEFD